MLGPLDYEVANVATLVDLYQKGYLELLRLIQAKDLVGKSTTQKKVLLAQVDKILEGLDSDTRDWVEKNIPEAYRTGAKDVVADLEAQGVPVKYTAFSQLHQKAVEVIASETYSQFASALKTVKMDILGTFNTALKQELIQEFAKNTITGGTRKELIDQIQNIIEQKGITSLQDKRGVTWQLDRYAEMLARTKTAEATRIGGENRMLENNQDLAQITVHFGTCESCAPAEGKIYSLTGKTPGYPSLEELKSNAPHLFGPNCRHRSVPYIAKYDKMAKEFKDLSNTAEPIDHDTLNAAGFKVPTEPKIIDVPGQTIKGDTVYRAVDSTNKEAVLGPGTYYGYDKKSVARYGKDIKTFTVDPRAKMLNLSDPDALEKFTQDAIKNNPAKFEALTKKYGDMGVGYLRAEVAQSMGFDGIRGDDMIFGSVVFDNKHLIAGAGKSVNTATKALSISFEGQTVNIPMTMHDADFITSQNIKFQCGPAGVFKKDTLGCYVASQNKIYIKNPLEDHTEHTLLHEIGHAVDYKKLPGITKLSSSDAFLAAKKADQREVAIRRLMSYSDKKYSVTREMAEAFYDTGAYKGKSMSYAYMTYVKSPKEIIADSYAQYRLDPIAFKSFAPNIAKYFEEVGL